MPLLPVDLGGPQRGAQLLAAPPASFPKRVDPRAKTFVLRQFNVEGFVNRLVLDPQQSDDKRFVFVSESAENAPPGMRVRLTCRIESPDAFEERRARR